MPLYDYQCSACEDTFEKLVVTSNAATIVCPACGSSKIAQLVSAPTIHNTSSKNDGLHREYKDYRKRWKENAYMPKPKKA